MKGILMEPSDLYHAEPVWRIREAVADYFAALYGTHDLATSFDRINMFPAPTEDGRVPVQRIGPWLHTDQTPLRNGRLCIQAFVDLLGTGEKEGGLVVADKSHLQHHTLLYQTWKIKEGKNWCVSHMTINSHFSSRYKFTDTQRAYIEANFTLMKVHCPPRSMVMWDSRVFHQNTPPSLGGHARAIVYVCMQPWAHLGEPKAIAKAKAKKLKAFVDKRGTSHWPLLNTLFARYARSWGKPLPVYDTSANVIRQPDLDAPQNARIAQLAGRTVLPLASAPGEPLIGFDAPLMRQSKKQLLKALGDHERPEEEEDEDEEMEPDAKRVRVD
jgi:hypothetical protein